MKNSEFSVHRSPFAVLDDLPQIESLDASKMRDLLDSLPRQVEEGIVLGEGVDLKVNREVRTILLSGIGGSAIGGDLLRSALRDEIRMPFFVNREDSLPNFVDEKTLLFIVSYSGETEETLSAYEEGKKRRPLLVGITSGGRLGEIFEKNGTPCITLPGGLPPRCALGYLTIPILVVLQRLDLVRRKKKDLGELLHLLSSLRDRFHPSVPLQENRAKAIASRLYHHFPLIYTHSTYFEGVAHRWETQLNENAKIFAHTDLFPELNHNEVMGWDYLKGILEGPLRPIAVLLKDCGSSKEEDRRMKLTQETFQNLGMGCLEVESEGKGLLSRIFSLVYLGDYISFYLAILRGIDPTPIPRITEFKSRLKEIHHKDKKN